MGLNKLHYRGPGAPGPGPEARARGPGPGPGARDPGSGPGTRGLAVSGSSPRIHAPLRCPHCSGGPTGSKVARGGPKGKWWWENKPSGVTIADYFETSLKRTDLKHIQTTQQKAIEAVDKIQAELVARKDCWTDYEWNLVDEKDTSMLAAEALSEKLVALKGNYQVMKAEWSLCTTLERSSSTQFYERLKKYTADLGAYMQKPWTEFVNEELGLMVLANMNAEAKKAKAGAGGG